MGRRSDRSETREGRRTVKEISDLIHVDLEVGHFDMKLEVLVHIVYILKYVSYYSRNYSL